MPGRPRTIARSPPNSGRTNRLPAAENAPKSLPVRKIPPISSTVEMAFEKLSHTTLPPLNFGSFVRACQVSFQQTGPAESPFDHGIEDPFRVCEGTKNFEVSGRRVEKKSLPSRYSSIRLRFPAFPARRLEHKQGRPRQDRRQGCFESMPNPPNYHPQAFHHPGTGVDQNQNPVFRSVTSPRTRSNVLEGNRKLDGFKLILKAFGNQYFLG